MRIVVVIFFLPEIEAKFSIETLNFFHDLKTKRLDTSEAWTELNWYVFLCCLIKRNEKIKLTRVTSLAARSIAIAMPRLTVRFFSHIQHSSIFSQFVWVWYVFFSLAAVEINKNGLIRNEFFFFFFFFDWD